MNIICLEKLIFFFEQYRGGGCGGRSPPTLIDRELEQYKLQIKILGMLMTLGAAIYHDPKLKETWSTCQCNRIKISTL